MICIREDAFKEFEEKNGFKIFRGRSVYLGILYEEGMLEEFREEIKKNK